MPGGGRDAKHGAQSLETSRRALRLNGWVFRIAFAAHSPQLRAGVEHRRALFSLFRRRFISFCICCRAAAALALALSVFPVAALSAGSGVEGSTRICER